MSWTKIDVEGHGMWQRCDGIIVKSYEQIEVIEKYENRQNNKDCVFRENSYNDDEIEEDYKIEELGPIGTLIITSIITILITAIFVILATIDK
jgi:hypothetical protein